MLCGTGAETDGKTAEIWLLEDASGLVKMDGAAENFKPQIPYWWITIMIPAGYLRFYC